MARTSVTRRSSRKSLAFEPAVAWSSRAFISVVSSAPHAPKMANAWLCSMRPTLLHSGTSLALNVSPGPAPSWKRVRTLPQLTNAGCQWTPPAWPGSSWSWCYGSQIGVHMCGERPAAVISTNAAGNNFWALRSLSSSSTVINWPAS